MQFCSAVFKDGAADTWLFPLPAPHSPLLLLHLLHDINMHLLQCWSKIALFTVKLTLLDLHHPYHVLFRNHKRRKHWCKDASHTFLKRRSPTPADCHFYGLLEYLWHLIVTCYKILRKNKKKNPTSVVDYLTLAPIWAFSSRWQLFTLHVNMPDQSTRLQWTFFVTWSKWLERGNSFYLIWF